MRLMLGRHEIAVEKRNRLAVKFVGSPAIELEIAGAGLDVGTRLLHRLARVAGLDQGQLFRMVEDDETELRQQPPPLRRREPAPGARLVGFAGGGDRSVDIGRIAGGDLGEGDAFGRRIDIDRAAGGGRPPAIVDEDAPGGFHGGGALDGFGGHSRFSRFADFMNGRLWLP